MNGTWQGLRHMAGKVAGRRSAMRWRAGLLAALALFAILALALVGGQGWLFGMRTAVTDNAYVGADVAQISAQIDGTVQTVGVGDTQIVRRGDVLVSLDPADADLALAQAQAGYASAQRRVRQYEANIEIAAAQVAVQQAEVMRARDDFERRTKLAGKGTISHEDLIAATAGYDKARAALSSAQGARAAAQALVKESDIEQNPEVLAAKALLDTARLNKARTIVRAPMDGVIARRQVQIGQRIQIGAPLMTIVPLTDVYVDANFKEGQLRRMRAGQSVRLTSDLYGSEVVFTGRVVGLGGGTGSAFAIIPAQNATGNWIKVVQRLPVRIALDPDELKAHPLRVGLSMRAVVELAP